MDLSNRVLTKRIKPDASGWTVAAGAADVASDIVDTAGYDGAIANWLGAVALDPEKARTRHQAAVGSESTCGMCGPYCVFELLKTAKA